MKTTLTFKPQQPVLKQTELTVNLLYVYLKGLCEQRYQAIGLYPHAKGFRERMESISIIREALKNRPINQMQCIVEVLRLENHFLILTPMQSSRLYTNYRFQVGDLMDKCRLALGRVKQY